MEEQKNNRTKILNLRLTEAEYKLLHERFGKTVKRKFSDYARAALLNKPVVMGYRDLSMDALIGEFAQLRKDLNGIANNVNQSVHKLHTMDDKRELATWLNLFERQHARTTQHIEDIRVLVGKMAEKWLQ